MDVKDKLTDLYDALLALQTREEAHSFLKDLLTPLEETSIQERWKVCQLIHSEKFSYRDIHSITGASLVTIGRVARFLKTENYKGYQVILKRLEQGDK